MRPWTGSDETSHRAVRRLLPRANAGKAVTLIYRVLSHPRLSSEKTASLFFKGIMPFRCTGRSGMSRL